MAKGQLKIDSNGKISLEGVMFDVHVEHTFEAFLDTGATDDFVINQSLADAVCAEITREEKRSTGGGSGEVSGLMRRVNLRFGNLEVKNIEVFVPKISITRNLLGISFLQRINAFVMLDFKAGKTKGGLLTNDRNIPYIAGKSSHLYCSHQKWVVDKNPCEVCKMQGEIN